MYNVQLKTPFTCIVAGSTGTGKTSLVYNILRYRKSLFSTPPEKVFLFYNVRQELYDSMLQSGAVDEIYEGLPAMQELIDMIAPHKAGGGTCCIFDDSLQDVNENLEKIFTQISHHHNCSVFFMSQNIFYQSTRYRTMNLNTQYLFVMKYPRAMGQVMLLARQISPYQTKHIIAAFQDATRSAYKYLLFDFKASTPDHIRIRSDILPYEWPMAVYMESQVSKRDQKNRWR